MRIQDTGRKVFHPPTCGRCHGAGCPIVELVVEADDPDWLPRAMTRSEA